MNSCVLLAVLHLAILHFEFFTLESVSCSLGLASPFECCVSFTYLLPCAAQGLGGYIKEASFPWAIVSIPLSIQILLCSCIKLNCSHLDRPSLETKRIRDPRLTQHDGAKPYHDVSSEHHEDDGRPRVCQFPLLEWLSPLLIPPS